MNDKYIEISKQLREERKSYEKYREAAVSLSTGVIDSQLRAAMTEHIKALDAAIVSVDQALKITKSN
jgi:flagellar biosynthesis chaperone FliJ